MGLRPIFAAGLLIALMLATGCLRPPAPGDKWLGDTRLGDTPLGAATPRDRALKGRLYLLPSGADRLPDFRRLKPVGALYVRSLDIPDQNLRTVFPDGVRRNQPFAADYQGVFSARTDGPYRFRLLSDDGARLIIDGRAVIDNDGTPRGGPAHGGLPRAGEATVTLGGADHTLEVQYFHDPRNRIALRLDCQAPGGPVAPFPGCGLALSRTGLWRVWLMWVAVLASLGAAVLWQTRRRIARESRGLR